MAKYYKRPKMLTCIIHDENNTIRHELLMEELQRQGMTDYIIFPSIHDVRSVKRGINRAHKQVVEYAQLLGVKEVCVLEDDFLGTHPNSWNYFLSKKPEDFDLYLGGIYAGIISEDNTVRDYCGGHCTIVHERFYDTYLSVPEDAHIDQAMSGLGKFVVCNPFAFIQHENLKSSNTGKIEVYRHLLQGRQLYKGG